MRRRQEWKDTIKVASNLLRSGRSPSVIKQLLEEGLEMVTEEVALMFDEA